MKTSMIYETDSIIHVLLNRQIDIASGVKSDVARICIEIINDESLDKTDILEALCFYFDRASSQLRDMRDSSRSFADDMSEKSLVYLAVESVKGKE